MVRLYSAPDAVSEPAGVRALPVAALKVGMTIRLGDYTFTIMDMRFAYPITGKVGVFDGDWWWGLSATFRVPIISYPK